MKLKTIFKNIVVLSICLAMVLSVSMPSAFAASYEKSGKVRIEAEGNDVYADYQGGNVVIIENDTSASGGQTVRTDMDNWSWKFTPSVTATYTFEMFGTGGGDYISLDAPYNHSSYGPDFIEWTVYAPTTGTYTIKLNVAYNNGSNGADTPRGHIMVDGQKASDTITVATGSNVMCTAQLTRGMHTIRYNHEGYRITHISAIEYDAPAGIGIVYKLDGAEHILLRQMLPIIIKE